MPISNVKTVDVKFTCIYEIFGDVDGLDWLSEQLIHAKTEKKSIKSFDILSVDYGVWGIQICLYQVVVSIPPLDNYEAQDLVLPTLNEIVGDTDVKILYTSAA